VVLAVLDPLVYNMAYYNKSDLQPVHAADAWNLDRYLFTALAYIARAGKKNGSKYHEDVCKAIWFLAYAVTGQTEVADKVKGLVADCYEYDQAQKNKTQELPKHASVTAGSGNVDEYRPICRVKEPELASEASNTGVSEESYPDRVVSWLKGAIE
jgi:hypothetical protein